MSDITNISWHAFHRDAKQLAYNIKTSGIKYSCILAVSRGGLTLAHILANELDIKKVLTICISSYSNKQRGRLLYHYKPSRIDIVLEDKILVVDDLADTGKSIKYIKKTYPLADMDFAVLYVKEECKVSVSYGVEFQVTNWIKFPWENE